MRPDWRECPRGDVVGQWSELYISLNRKGWISMTRPTYERLDEPKAFVLFFDTVNNRIGLKPSALTTRNAFPVAKRGRHGGRIIRAYRLLQEFRIDLPETMRFTNIDTDEDGTLMLDLRTAKVSTRALGYKKSLNSRKQKKNSSGEPSS